MRRLSVCLLALCLTASASSPAFALDLEVLNKSKTTIQHLYLSATSANNWGDDQLGDEKDDTIEPGDSFTLTDIEPGAYDLKLVSLDSTECIVKDIRFGASKEWTITEAMLDACHN